MSRTGSTTKRSANSRAADWLAERANQLREALLAVGDLDRGLSGRARAADRQPRRHARRRDAGGAQQGADRRPRRAHPARRQAEPGAQAAWSGRRAGLDHGGDRLAGDRRSAPAGSGAARARKRSWRRNMAPITRPSFRSGPSAGTWQARSTSRSRTSSAGSRTSWRSPASREDSARGAPRPGQGTYHGEPRRAGQPARAGARGRGQSPALYDGAQPLQGAERAGGSGRGRCARDLERHRADPAELPAAQADDRGRLHRLADARDAVRDRGRGAGERSALGSRRSSRCSACRISGWCRSSPA